MTQDGGDVFTCLHCGQVQRDGKWAGLFARGWMSGHCRICGTQRGHKTPTLPGRIDGATTMLGYYAMMAFVWAVIVFFPGALLVGMTIGLADHPWATGVLLGAGAAIGLVKAEKQRRRGEVVQRYQAVKRDQA